MSQIGIDFGNKYIRIFETRHDNAEVITNELGERRFINLMAFRSNKRYLSYEVENNLVGMMPYTFLHSRSWIFSKKNIPQLSDVLVEKIFQKPLKLHILIVLLNYLFKNIKKPWKNCVISLDSTLPFITKKNVILLFKRLGFEKVTITNDITSLAVSYGHLDMIKGKFSQQKEICLFLDIGELNTKIGVVEFRDKKMLILENKHREGIGGYYLQLEIIRYLIKHVENKYNIKIEQSSSYLFAEISFTIMKNLVLMPNYTIRDEINYNDQTYELNLDLSRDILDTILNDWEYYLNNILTSLASQYQVDKVFLTGNTSRFPKIRDFVTGLIKDKLCSILHIEESLGKGCALQNLIKHKYEIIQKIQENIYFKISGDERNLLIFRQGEIIKSHSITINKWTQNAFISLKYGDQGKFNLLGNLSIFDNNIPNNHNLTLYLVIDNSGLVNLDKIILNHSHKVDLILYRDKTNYVDLIIKKEKKIFDNIEKKKKKTNLISELDTLNYENGELIKEMTKIINTKVDGKTRSFIKKEIELSEKIINHPNNSNIDKIKVQIKHQENIKKFIENLKKKYFTV